MTRGRTAETPTDIPGSGWKDILFRVKDEITEDRVSLIAAGVAFYGFLALFPAIGAVMALSGVIWDPADITDQIGSLAGLVPEDIIDIILAQATAVTHQKAIVYLHPRRLATNQLHHLLPSALPRPPSLLLLRPPLPLRAAPSTSPPALPRLPPLLPSPDPRPLPRPS